MSTQSPILIDYDFSPFGQKIRLLLAAAKIPFRRCVQPMVLPRPTLEKLDITYRRIPLLAIGKLVYCDTSLITELLLSDLITDLRKVDIPRSNTDKAYEAFGMRVFSAGLALVPSQALTPDFVKDRQTIFPILKRPDLKEMRPSAVAEFRSNMHIVETQFLENNDWISGNQIGLADIHVAWVFRWILEGLGVSNDEGCKKEDFPKVYSWLDRLPKEQIEEIDQDATIKEIQDTEAVGTTQLDDNDPLGMSKGTKVTVEATDAEPGRHPQGGKLVGATMSKVVIELHNGIRMHFPRAGTLVKKA